MDVSTDGEIQVKFDIASELFLILTLYKNSNIVLSPLAQNHPILPRSCLLLNNDLFVKIPSQPI